jgi:hypothetical protein
MVERTVFLGPTVQVLVRLVGGQVVQSIEPNRGDAAARPQGEPVSVHLPPEDVRTLSTRTVDTQEERPAVPAP